MHICHINLAKEFRGGERQTYLLIQGLSELHIKQTLVCRRNSPMATRARNISGLTIIEINKPFLRHITKPKNCDLIHAHEGRSSHFAYLASKYSKKPYLITRRIPNLPSSSFLTQKTYVAAITIVALSRAIKNQLLKYQVDLPIEIIPSMKSDLPFDEESVAQLEKKFTNKYIIGHIGALVEHHKGQKTIIETAKNLQNSHPEIHFLLLGKGQDEKELKAYAKGLTNIDFVGYVDNVGDYMKLFDLFVFPSREEGLGSILLDVMQFQKPIIASNVDGIPDIISHNNNGLLIEPGNAQQLEESILKLKNDPELASQLASEGANLVKNYSIEKISQLYLALYRKLLK